MAKSLLSSFKNDFNRIISILQLQEWKNEIWEIEKDHIIINQTWIKCLLLLSSQDYWLNINNQVNLIKTTHKIRMDFKNDVWDDILIKIWDQIQDDKNNLYKVVFITPTPWFGWFDDHLLVFCDIIK